MVGRTHVIGGISAVIGADVLYKGYSMNVPTAYFVTIAAILGALSPDLDSPSSIIYHKIPAGSFLGRIIHPVFIGGHRHLSHSLLGLGIFAYISRYFLYKIPSYTQIDIHAVWISYLIGIISHLFLDSLTTEGIPLLFPFGQKFGIPPISSLRIKTGGLIEHLIVFPLLLLSIGYSLVHYYPIFLK